MSIDNSLKMFQFLRIFESVSMLFQLHFRLSPNICNIIPHSYKEGNSNDKTKNQ